VEKKYLMLYTSRHLYPPRLEEGEGYDK